jgi:hypothetical protein
MVRNIVISRALSWILHRNEACLARSDGFVPVDRVLTQRQMLTWHVKQSELQLIVDTDDKQRFQMEEEDSPLPLQTCCRLIQEVDITIAKASHNGLCRAFYDGVMMLRRL